MSGDTYDSYVRLTVTNGPRVLARISTLISGRGHRILSARYTQDGSIARMSLRVTGPAHLRDNLLCRVAQCVEVIDVDAVAIDLDPAAVGERVGVCDPTSDDRVQVRKLRTYLRSDGRRTHAEAALELVVDGDRILAAADGETTLEALTGAFREALRRVAPSSTHRPTGELVLSVLDDEQPAGVQVVLQGASPTDRYQGTGTGADIAVAASQALAALYAERLPTTSSSARAAAVEVAP